MMGIAASTTQRFLCPVDGCDWTHDVKAPEVSDGDLAGLFGPGVMARAASFQHAGRVERELQQHLDGHTLVEWVQTTARQRDELERLRDGVRRLAEGRCDCDVSHLGGHDYGCSSRIETVDRDDLWALLEGEEPFDG